MDIVDTQVHFNRLGSWEAGVAAMDSVGVNAVLYDESIVGRSASGHVLPGQSLPNGSFRPLCPQAEALALQDPDRFGVLRRVDPRDPDLETVARLMRDAPYAKAFRVILYDPELKTNDFDAFGAGDYDPVFEAADRNNLPVVVLVPGQSGLLRRYLQKFPDVSLVIDHCGVPLVKGSQGSHLDAVLELADFENATLKWGHAPFLFSGDTYPFTDALELLQRALAAFGENRLMWASDWTVTAKHFSWAETLFYIRNAQGISATAKEWILGRTARAVYRWPQIAKPTP